ncbi:olfactory receptor 2G3-like [Heteronotia binoei]|uniref:olfactory receptor 2G3-like n=1 Tax=Heteronotia binoei TaxID=13085 RepID=UPI00292CE5FC|nr:olfactory receptor 2G3-like [Heteronotia binoei]
MLKASCPDSSWQNKNETFVTEFIFLGLSSQPRVQMILFFVFLAFYLFSMFGNIIIILVVGTDFRLHTPMYFFLINLSILDISYTSTNVPQMLINLLTRRKTISFWGCATQMYFSLAFGMTECFLLGVMAYDRYVAICQPLQYTVIMNGKICIRLASFCWSSSLVSSMIINTFTLQLPFCGLNILNHYFCEVPAVLTLVCADTFLTEMVVFVFSIIIVFVPFLLIIVSYGYIFRAVLQIQTAKGRTKAFSTCASHLIVVVIFFGTAIFTYMRPSLKSAQDRDKVSAVFYTIIMPMLNPLIYSLRNKDVKSSLRRSLTLLRSSGASKRVHDKVGSGRKAVLEISLADVTDLLIEEPKGFLEQGWET